MEGRSGKPFGSRIGSAHCGLPLIPSLPMGCFVDQHELRMRAACSSR